MEVLIFNGTSLNSLDLDCLFMEVDTAGCLFFHFFKSFRLVVIFRGLIIDRKKIIPLFMIVLRGGLKRKFL